MGSRVVNYYHCADLLVVNWLQYVPNSFMSPCFLAFDCPFHTDSRLRHLTWLLPRRQREMRSKQRREKCPCVRAYHSAALETWGCHVNHPRVGCRGSRSHCQKTPGVPPVLVKADPPADCKQTASPGEVTCDLPGPECPAEPGPNCQPEESWVK